ncbi:uncharacterized protein [Antedon mediterranea]|uniref:uncharacterized protein n=1 Tax=Antedon mediterranea TaxID=105859 RepID=UPI003AF92913
MNVHDTDNDVTGSHSRLQRTKVEIKRKWKKSTSRQVSLDEDRLLKITRTFVDENTKVAAVPPPNTRTFLFRDNWGKLEPFTHNEKETSFQKSSNRNGMNKIKKEREFKFQPPNNILDLTLCNNEDISNDNNSNERKGTQDRNVSSQTRHQNGNDVNDPKRAANHRTVEVNTEPGLVITNIVHLNAYYRCLSSLSRTTRYKKRYDNAIHSVRKESKSFRTKSPYWNWIRHALEDTKADKQFICQLLQSVKDGDVRLSSNSKFPDVRKTKCVSKFQSKRVCYNLHDNIELMSVDDILDAERSCKRKIAEPVRPRDTSK